MTKRITAFLYTYSGFITGLIYLTIMNFRNRIPVDAGDGVVHFSIARQSFHEPLYLLDHWGKPLFTLLSSPFAQINFKGYVCFNILVFALTCLLAFRIFKRLKAGWFYYVLFPLILISVPDYAYCVLGGMTEPLFGLLLLALTYFALCERWLLFGIIASFMPFARSEGMLVVIAAAGVLLLLKQWKFIPLLLTGFVLYAVAGWFAIGDAWWYFNNNPYPAGSMYGTGEWNHYIKTWDVHFGLLNLLLLIPGTLGWLILRNKKAIPHFGVHLLFGVGIYLAIIAIHSYFWTYGLRGSAGLTRIATLGLPSATLFILIGCSYVTRELGRIPHLIGGTVLSIIAIKEIRELPYPLQANPFEALLLQSAKYVLNHDQTATVYYYHPLIAWGMNIGIKDQHTRFMQFGFHNDSTFVTRLKEGSLLIRDPQFGPVEQGLPLDLIQQLDHTLVKVCTFRTNEPYSVYTGEPVEVVVYKIRHRKPAHSH